VTETGAAGAVAIVTPWFLDPFRDRAARTGIALHYLILRPDLATCLARAQARPDGLTLSAPIRQVHGQFTALGALEAHVIDSAGQPAAETAAQVTARITDGSARLAPAL
jgi:hypothetical protein